MIIDKLFSDVILGDDLARPLTFHELSPSGVNSVGHMSTLQGAPTWIGLGKQGEKFVNNVFAMIQPLLPVHQRALLSLSRIQYEKIKVQPNLSYNICICRPTLFSYLSWSLLCLLTGPANYTEWQQKTDPLTGQEQ